MSWDGHPMIPPEKTLVTHGCGLSVKKRRAGVTNPWGVPHKPHQRLDFSFRIIPLRARGGGGGGGTREPENITIVDFLYNFKSER